MTDLVKRLRSPANVFYEYAADDGAFLHEAANRIEKLEVALREIASIDSYYVSDIVDFARKALEEKDD